MNVAIHMKKLGHDARFAGRVGNDAMGRSLASFLIKHGIDTSLLQIDHLLPTGTVEVNLTNENDVSFSIVDNVAYDNMSVDTDLLHVAEESDAIVYGTLASRHEHTRETILKLLDATPGIKVVDVNLRPPYDSREVTALMLSKADIAKLNDNELKTISEWYNIDLPEKETMEWFTDRFRLKLVCLTKGANGAMIYDAVNKKSFIHDGYKVKVVDTLARRCFSLRFSCLLSGQKFGRVAYTCQRRWGTGSLQIGRNPEYTLKEVVKIIRGQQIKVTTRELI